MSHRLLTAGDYSTDPHGSVGEWDVSHVTDVNRIFSDFTCFDVDLSKWNVVVTVVINNIDMMLRYVTSFKQVLCGEECNYH